MNFSVSGSTLAEQLEVLPHSARVTFGIEFRMFNVDFLQVLSFPATAQKYAGIWICHSNDERMKTYNTNTVQK